MTALRDTLEKLLDRRNLTQDEASALLMSLTDAATAPASPGGRRP